MFKKIFRVIYGKIANRILEKELIGYSVVIVKLYQGRKYAVYSQTLFGLLYGLKLCGKRDFEIEITVDTVDNGKIVVDH